MNQHEVRKMVPIKTPFSCVVSQEGKRSIYLGDGDGVLVKIDFR
jgi:hypothetical protein